MARSSHGMQGPRLEIRLVDRKGNVLQNEGEACEDWFEFETLSETIGAYATAVEILNEEFGEDEAEEDEGPDDADEND